MVRLQLDNVSLVFTVRRHKRLSLKEFVLRGMFRRSVNPRMTVHALQDISLRLRDGERLGVVGHNGAGKSTLLKVMAGVYPLTRGRRIVNGRVSSLFDVALGFEPDASGWENIRYRGYLQGETPETISRKMQVIAEFSELGEFLDIPVRYYSSGMIVRLGFSIAVHIQPDILLLDEALSAGDAGFRAKAGSIVNRLRGEKKIVIIASHNMPLIRSLCTSVIWLEKGRIRMEGDPTQVTRAYYLEHSKDSGEAGSRTEELEKAATA